MTPKYLIIASLLIYLSVFQDGISQDARGLPFDPFAILKSWNYDKLVKTMGEGEEILGTMNNQPYLAGLRYPADLLGMNGKLEFSFNKDSIARFKFRREHVARVIDAALAGRMALDTAVTGEYNRGIQKADSFRRDSVVLAISGILGPPLNSGLTTGPEKTVRYSAIWTKSGYSCFYKDYLDYCEIVFTLTTVPLRVVGEFEIPAGTEIIQKTFVKTRKMNWTASLLGIPSVVSRMAYSEVYLLLEFATGQVFLTSVPEQPVSFFPELFFEDCDGDAIPEAWIRVPSDFGRSQTRHYLFSLRLKEPNLIFNSDEQIPAGISFQSNSITVSFRDGSALTVESALPADLSSQNLQLKPDGYNYLSSTKLNSDGTAIFIGGIELRFSPEAPPLGIIEITFKHFSDGWKADQIRLIRKDS
jgi:hypothetical protein